MKRFSITTLRFLFITLVIGGGLTIASLTRAETLGPSANASSSLEIRDSIEKNPSDTKISASGGVQIIKIATTSTSAKGGGFASTTKRLFENAKASINTMRAEEKRKVDEKIDSLRSSRLAERNAKIDAYMKRTVNRFNAAIERLLILSDRISSRLDKLSAQGIDESEARAKLQTAQNDVFEAQNKIDTLSASTTTNLNQDDSTVRTSSENFKQNAENALISLKDAHSALVEVMKSIKPGFNTKATTTADVKTKHGTTTGN